MFVKSLKVSKNVRLFDLHCVQKKIPTHVFFYIYMEDVQISAKFSGNV